MAHACILQAGVFTEDILREKIVTIMINKSAVSCDAIIVSYFRLSPRDASAFLGRYE